MTSFLKGLLNDPAARNLLIVLGVFIFIVWPLLLLYSRWAQGNQPQAWEVMARDTRKPVLYLRPFKTDEYEFTVHEGSKGEVRRLRAEALLLEPFEILGPLVAIGRPGEDMPPWGGAARQYVGDDWQSIFRVLLDRAQLAVLFAGTTGNFQWELGQVFHHEPFVPTILLLPAGQHWKSKASLRSSFTAATGIELPEGVNTARLIYFPARAQPIPFADTGDRDDRLLTVYNPYLGALTRVMELIQPGSAAPWIKKAHANERAKILGIATGVLITLLILTAKASG
jgi:hypothetical protein